MIFDPELLERELRDDPANALQEMASAIHRGEATVRLRGTVQGVGSTDPAREHYLLSLDLGVPTVQPRGVAGELPVLDPLMPNYFAALMREMLQGRGLCQGRRR